MKIRVKHKETEFIVEDDNKDNAYDLIYYNQEYVLKLIKEITQHIINITKGDDNI
jgi:hypothetical protein